jgi:hypothetical protein
VSMSSIPEDELAAVLECVMHEWTPEGLVAQRYYGRWRPSSMLMLRIRLDQLIRQGHIERNVDCYRQVQPAASGGEEVLGI